jgi:hypothetical protein
MNYYMIVVARVSATVVVMKWCGVINGCYGDRIM